MDLSHVVACGLFLALLALGLEAKPAPRHLPKGPSPGSAVALGRQLAELLEAPSGAARGGGGTKAAAAAAGAQQQQQQQQQQPAAPRGKGSSPAASQRLLRDLRTDARQARRGWGRLLPSEHHGGGGGGSRRPKGTNPRKGQSRGCFGLKLDRIGSMSGLGC